MISTKVVDVYFTIGTNIDGKIVPWGEFHRNKELAEAVAKVGLKGYKDIKVIHKRTNNAIRLFHELLKTGI